MSASRRELSDGKSRREARGAPPSGSIVSLADRRGEPSDTRPAAVTASAATASASTRRVMGGALALFTIQPLTWASSLLMIVYMPQYMGSVTMGQWAILMALSGLCATIFGFGVPTVLTRQIAAEPARITQASAAALILSLGLAVGGGAAVALAIHGFGMIDLPPYTLEVMLAGVVVTVVQNLLLSILNGQHRLGRFAQLSAVSAIVSSVGLIAALMGGFGLIGMLTVMLVVNAVVTTIGWRGLHLQFDWSSVSLPELHKLAVMGLPFAGMALVLRLRGDAEVMLLGLGLSVEVLGWWSAAERIAYIALFVPTLLITPLLPALSSVAHDVAAFRSTLRRSLDLTVVVTLGASAGVTAIAPAVPSAFGWTPDFVAAIPFIELISMVTPLVSVGMILGTALIALADERRWFVTSVVASSLHLIVTPALIVGFNLAWGAGGIGAAVAKLLIEMLMIVGALRLLPRGTVERSSWIVVAKSLVAAGAMVVLVRAVLALGGWYALPLSIAAGGLTYLIVLAAIRIMSPSELAELRAFAVGIVRRRAG
ncbi:MAG: hypothetical protein IT306_04490 [Chloroflexi bacterium]|nr:hypothetical protein [Chloroflexota bacterium]